MQLTFNKAHLLHSKHVLSTMQSAMKKFDAYIAEDDGSILLR